MKSRIIVAQYDPAWPDIFEEIRASLTPVVSRLALAIEHVGSTAVPGLAAKPVIDIDVVVAPRDLTAGIRGLESLGYDHRGELGVPGREAFRAPAGTPGHHLYLCPEDSPALANHIAIRDYLRSDPAAVAAYGELKRSLAHAFPNDMDAYVEGKTGFLLNILTGVGFSQAALDDIERMNARG